MTRALLSISPTARNSFPYRFAAYSVFDDAA
jgi:hypothetical protein